MSTPGTTSVPSPRPATTETSGSPLFHNEIHWKDRLAEIVATMREMSTQTDPQAMVAAYGARRQRFLSTDGMISLSRRGLAPPHYRITRSSKWVEPVNPWKEPHRLPVFTGGVLGDWLYRGEPMLLHDYTPPADDPAAEYLNGYRSFAVIPHYEKGEVINMVVMLRHRPDGFPAERFPEMVWQSNRFGRATSNLVLSEMLTKALSELDEELKLVGGLQRSLLPRYLPMVPGMDLAVSYRTSQRAGGDYYDFFPLADGRWGIIIADVSGHGPPAAMLMAVTHAIAHASDAPQDTPSRMLAYINKRLTARYTSEPQALVTALYGIYDPTPRRFEYSSAGHNPPRVKRCSDGSIATLDDAQGLPLGILAEQDYPEAKRVLLKVDQIVFYTDGITEAFSAADEMFGEGRLDEVLGNCTLTAEGLLAEVERALGSFTDGRPPQRRPDAPRSQADLSAWTRLSAVPTATQLWRRVKLDLDGFALKRTLTRFPPGSE